MFYTVKQTQTKKQTAAIRWLLQKSSWHSQKVAEVSDSLTSENRALKLGMRSHLGHLGAQFQDGAQRTGLFSGGFK